MLFNFQRARLAEIKEVSATNAEGPPVPIPNTEVKLCSGENTLRATVREDSSVLTLSRSGAIHSDDFKKTVEATTADGGVAQLGEHLPCKQGVMGSNPIISTKQAEGLQLKMEN